MDRITQIYAQTGLTLDPIEFFTGGDAGNAVIRNPGSPVEPAFVALGSAQGRRARVLVAPGVTDSSDRATEI